ncbi:transient receptor potential cation channel subfamily M member-like 2 isoform X1 [Acropora palmata]|uniref:transient receptor potential cation channel subfamily M member-like 2 isoform X1 n=2 Tax=Acropora palmata TaxID=6131 RepID=UPI003DA195CE
MLGFKSNKVQGVSSVSLTGRSADPPRHSRGSQSGSLHGFELLEKNKKSWIGRNFKKRECIKIIEDVKKTTQLNVPFCKCGRKRSAHDGSIAREDTSSDQWTPERCTRKLPTDAYGEIDFLGLGRQTKRVPYVRLSHNTDVSVILKLMLEGWDLEIPNLVISVTGGAKSFVLKPRLKEVFRRGLIKAAKSTSAWIITGGTNTGVMKHVGEAVREHEMTLGSEDKVNVIGIATWGIVDRKESLIASKDQNGLYPALYRMENDPESSGALLDSNHSHFLLVDNGTEEKYGVEIDLRSKFEEAVMKVKTDSRSAAGAIGVPVVLLVLEGGPNTIRTMCELIKKKIPAVVVDGSGRAADLVAFAYSHTIKESEGISTVNVIDPVFEGKVRRKVKELFPFMDAEKVSEHYNMIEQLLKDEKMISIYRLDDETNISQDIDLAILKALLKANSSSPLVQLNLALAWNRIDVAKSEIFTDERRWTTVDLANPMITALLDDKAEFVELFLQNGLSMREFLSPQILCQLYAGVPSNSVIKPLLQREMGKKNVKVVTIHIVGEVIEKLMADSYHSDYLRDEHYLSPARKISAQALVMANAMNAFDPLPRQYRDVFIWAVLCNRMALAKVMWINGREQIACALMATRLLKSMAAKSAADDTITDISAELFANADDFEEHAIGVLQECYEQNEVLSQTLLVRELDSFDQLTALDFAVMAEDQNFISHVSCQVLLTRLWMGTMAMNTQWWKIIICIFFPFLIFPFIYFVPDEQQEREAAARMSRKSLNNRSMKTVRAKSGVKAMHTMSMNTANGHTDGEDGKREGNDREDLVHYLPELHDDNSMEVMMRSKDLTVYERVSSFYSAPFTKFMGNLVAYVMFILLYAYVITMYFPRFDSSQTLGGLSKVEVILYFWIFTIIVEEMRQLASQQPRNFVHKLSVYFSDTWNLVDAFSLLAFVVAAVLRFFDSTFEAARIILSLNIIVFIVRSLQIFSVNRQLGPKLVMIRKMLEDLKQFVIILVIFIIAYGIALQAVSFPGPGKFSKGFGEVVRGIVDLPYWQMYGELFLEEISGQKPDEYGEVHPTAKWLSQALLAGYMLFTNVLLLNLLIAIFSYTFERVQEDSDKVWKFQRYELIAEYHGRPLFFPPLIFISHILLFVRWIWQLCRCGNPPSGSSLKIQLSEYEKEQMMNWEFQGAEYFVHKKKAEEKNTLEKRVCALGDRLNNATVKLDRLMECVLDTTNPGETEDALTSSQPTFEWRPPTRDTAGLERRLVRLEENVAAIHQTMKTVVDLLQNEKTGKVFPKTSEPGPANILDLRPVAPAFIHHKSRASPYPQCAERRFPVPDENVPWEVDFSEYNPVNYTAPVVLRNPPWADPDLMSMDPLARPPLAYNVLDEEYHVNRASHMGAYRVKHGLPLNPMGRTGMSGRGLLGRFGPNHAADPIVTRWKRTSAGVMLDGGKKVLEFVAIQRRDNSQWAIPGGMVEPGQVVTQALKAEFGEEAMAKLDVTEEERDKISSLIDKLFNNGNEVYKGYVDDPRNTDNAWMETVAVNFHDDTGEIFSEFKLQAGDDAAAVRWQRVSGNIPLFASHVSILEKVAKMRSAAF